MSEMLAGRLSLLRCDAGRTILACDGLGVTGICEYALRSQVYMRGETVGGGDIICSRRDGVRGVGMGIGVEGASDGIWTGVDGASSCGMMAGDTVMPGRSVTIRGGEVGIGVEGSSEMGDGSTVSMSSTVCIVSVERRILILGSASAVVEVFELIAADAAL